MYRNLSFAAALLAAAFSGPVLAEGINSFSQAKAAGVKVNADAPGDFYCGCKINWQGKKGSLTSNHVAIKYEKMKTAPAELNGSTLSPPGNLVISASAGRMEGAKTAPKIRSIAKWKAICITCSLRSVK